MSALRVLFIGAGAVNFGGAEGPWDHSRRLERLGGVRVVAIADPDLPKATRVLEAKLSGAHKHMYEGCQLFASYTEAIATCKVDVAFIGEPYFLLLASLNLATPSLAGVPPFAHGNPSPPRDIELRCLEAGLHLFVEKPISVIPPEELDRYTHHSYSHSSPAHYTLAEQCIDWGGGMNSSYSTHYFYKNRFTS